ncbi:TauD/TfdA family dioxygenase [Pseudomonas sp. LRP2-20]|uniref:TauD/TfdA family dioxygenase n=1 Tax=Pseudomonas sp. LRP2-20 TaxID=2944234 RepID=UPI002185E619|nr:TauD/TfdA family dioxygenase [Pseudomonas sp. LRP2-20]BDM22292.1 TauD/TfdA family dioxygenase [Pseudomonas sp. LRP2-20]
MSIRTTPVIAKSAWTPHDLANDNSWLYRLDSRGVDELEALLDKVRHLPITEITKADFPLDYLVPFVEAVDREVQHGFGMAVIRGLPVQRYTKEDASRIYWGIGLYLGTPVTQNKRAHLLGHVKDEGVTYSQKTRGYNTKAKLNFHTDNADVVGLLCLRTPQSGGLSRFSSSNTIFNRILETRPDLLEPLFEGFYYDLKGEQRPGAGELSDHKIPVFSDYEGYLSARYVRNAIEPAFAKSGEAKTALQEEALNLFDALATAPEQCFEMQFEPGDMQMLNNHTIVHSRTEFVDFEEDDRKRHLLRLWLRNDTRPLALEFAERFGPGTARMGVPKFDRDISEE